MTSRTLRLLAVSLFFLSGGCDVATKSLAEAHLASGPVTLVEGWAHLRLAHNTGVAFSMLDGAPPLALALMALALTGTALLALRSLATTWQGAAGFALIAAGGASNALDRVLRGAVTDMISVGRWPVFNVADVSVDVGYALLVLAMLRVERERSEREARRPPTA